MIADSPALLRIARDLIDFLADAEDDAPPELLALAAAARQVVRRIDESPAAPADAVARPAAKAG